jgi:hypothetical protein
MFGSRYIGIDNDDNKYLIGNDFKIYEETTNPITITPLEEITDEKWKESISPLYSR